MRATVIAGLACLSACSADPQSVSRTSPLQDCSSTPTGVEFESFTLDFVIPPGLMPDPQLDGQPAELYLRRAPHPHSVTLLWHAPAQSVDPQAVRYNLYRSTSPGGPYTPVASGVQSLTYKDELVNAGVTYYYVVRSVDLSGRESGYSEEVKVTIPDR